MTYSLQITAKALREIDDALEWRAKRSMTAAVRWYMQLLEAIRSMADNPEQCGFAPENARPSQAEDFKKEVGEQIQDAKMWQVLR